NRRNPFDNNPTDRMAMRAHELYIRGRWRPTRFDGGHMKVLVTGGSGTIGSYVLRELLRSGHSLKCYCRATAPLAEGAEFIAGDIMDLERLAKACRGCDAIVHLAAVPGPRRASPEQLMSINVIGTVHVLESAIQHGIRKVVFASSGAAAG